MMMMMMMMRMMMTMTTVVMMTWWWWWLEDEQSRNLQTFSFLLRGTSVANESTVLSKVLLVPMVPVVFFMNSNRTTICESRTFRISIWFDPCRLLPDSPVWAGVTINKQHVCGSLRVCLNIYAHILNMANFGEHDEYANAAQLRKQPSLGNWNPIQHHPQGILGRCLEN